MKTMLEYSNKNSFVHKLTGAAKILFLLAYVIASMISYDTRLLVGLLILSFIIFKVSKVEFKEISFVFYLSTGFFGCGNVPRNPAHYA